MRKLALVLLITLILTACQGVSANRVDTEATYGGENEVVHEDFVEDTSEDGVEEALAFEERPFPTDAGLPPTQTVTLVDLETIYNPEDGFIIEGLRWGMSKAEVEEVLGIELNYSGGNFPPMLTYATRGEITMFGRYEELGSIGYTFNINNDELITMQHSLSRPRDEDDELWAFYDEILEKLKHDLGEPDIVNEYSPPDHPMMGRRATWKHVVGGEERNQLMFVIENQVPERADSSTGLILTIAHLPLPEYE